jgi:hypothetical protein
MDNSVAKAKAEIASQMFRGAIEEAFKIYQDEIRIACNAHDTPDAVAIKGATKAYLELVQVACDETVKIICITDNGS